MGHRWVRFTDLNNGIFDGPANVGLSWEMGLCSTVWGEAGGVCCVAQGPQPSNTRLSEACCVTLLILHLILRSLVVE